MAPGRRTVRMGETRMDAAFDALVPMGFSKDVICRKVNELLKVYGGPEGWMFIEEGSYKLLIEGLLEVEDGTEPAPQLEAANQDNVQADAGSSSAVCPLNATAEPSPDMIQDLVNAEMTCEDAGSHQDSAMTQVDDVSPKHDLTNIKDEVSTPEVEHVRAAPPTVEPFVPHVSNIPSKRRRLCYGWWVTCNENDIIMLPRMPINGTTTHQRPVQRQSRWDVRPLQANRDGYR